MRTENRQIAKQLIVSIQTATGIVFARKKEPRDSKRFGVSLPHRNDKYCSSVMHNAACAAVIFVTFYSCVLA